MSAEPLRPSQSPVGLPMRAGFAPRAWQLAALDAAAEALAAGESPIVEACTGAGKGDWLAGMALRVALRETVTARKAGRAPRPVVVVVHLGELVDDLTRRCGQVAEAVAQRWQVVISVGQVRQSRRDLGAAVVVASRDSLAEADLGAMGSPVLLIIDEAHHATAPIYQSILRWARAQAVPAGGSAMGLIGMTATPFRADDKALGEVFTSICYSYRIEKAIVDGVLVRPIFVAVDVKAAATDTADAANQKSKARMKLAVEYWLQYAPGRSTVVFCVDRSHSAALALVFRESGVRAETIHGGMPDATKERILSEFRAGTITVLCSVALILEGFDAPRVSCVVACRAMKSDIMRRQAIGRGLRTWAAGEKTDCIAIDMTGGMKDWGLETEASLGAGTGEGSTSASRAALQAQLQVGSRVRLLDWPERGGGEIVARERVKWAVKWAAGPMSGQTSLHTAGELALCTVDDEGLATVRIVSHQGRLVDVLATGSGAHWPWFELESEGWTSYTVGGMSSGRSHAALVRKVSSGWVLWWASGPVGGEMSAEKVRLPADLTKPAVMDAAHARLEAERVALTVQVSDAAGPVREGTAARLRAIGLPARLMPSSEGLARHVGIAWAARRAMEQALRDNARGHVQRARETERPSGAAAMLARELPRVHGEAQRLLRELRVGDRSVESVEAMGASQARRLVGEVVGAWGAALATVEGSVDRAAAEGRLRALGVRHWGGSADVACAVGPVLEQALRWLGEGVGR